MLVETEALRIRIHAGEDPGNPTLVYLPGLHGDWTLIGGFRNELGPSVTFIEFTYPRTTTWSLPEYARQIIRLLEENGHTSVWLLAESFGSQVGWALLDEIHRGAGLSLQGLILAGGFVRYPWPPIIRPVRAGLRRLTPALLQGLLRTFSFYARWRYPATEELKNDLREFIARRTDADQWAALHRLDLIAGNDPRPIARSTPLPVYHLAGLIDPIVPWYRVRPWLRRNCPGFRESRIIPLADHNVLGWARPSARQIRHWLASRES